MVYKKILLLILSFIIVTGCLKDNRIQEGIYIYNADQDREYIIHVLNSSARFWLVSDESVGYDVAETLDTGLHGFIKKPVSFYMYYKDSKPVGFVSYYFESSLFGKFQFLYVDEQYRRQGIAEKLLNFSLKDMQQRGAYSLEIVARRTNDQAIALYKKVGFKFSYDDGKYIHLNYLS